ncbi:MAG: hypothetical protein ABFC24_02480 [Methanoregulaceae archaeon]
MRIVEIDMHQVLRDVEADYLPTLPEQGPFSTAVRVVDIPVPQFLKADRETAFSGGNDGDAYFWAARVIVFELIFIPYEAQMTIRSP